MGFVGMVWRGECSLAQTFWLWNVIVGGIVIGGISKAMVIALGSEGTASGAGDVVLLLLTVPYGLWIMVGLWRSASNNPGFWASNVKIGVVFQAIFAVIQWQTLLWSANLV